MDYLDIKYILKVQSNKEYYFNIFKTTPVLTDVICDNGEIIDTSTVQIIDNAIVFESIPEDAKEIILSFTIQHNKISAIIGNAGKALLKKQLEIPLEKNTEYQINLYTDEMIFEKEFKTEYDPFYTTVDKIRLDTGTLLKNISDETIAELIYDNSKNAIENWQDINGVEDTNSLNAALLGYSTKTNNTVLANLKLYVRYKTSIDLILAFYYGVAGNLGQERKRVGTVEVERQKKLPYLSDLLDVLKKRLIEPEKELFGSKIISKETLKAGKTPYPLKDPRRWERES